MNRTRQLLTGWGDLLLLALGIIALMLAQQVGLCLNDTSTGATCEWSGTMILDLLGFLLIAAGGTWALVRRWPRGFLRNPLVRFMATWAIVAVTGIVWAYGMLSDWHWGPYCYSSDDCGLAPDIGSSIALFLVIGFVMAAIATGIGLRQDKTNQAINALPAHDLRLRHETAPQRHGPTPQATNPAPPATLRRLGHRRAPPDELHRRASEDRAQPDPAH